jgi:CSLREA domain-containing protein
MIKSSTTWFFATPIGMIWLFAAIVAPLTTLPSDLHAATLTVTTTEDVLDDSDDLCSLREAVINANENTQVFDDCAAGEAGPTVVDTIVLQAATYTLSRYYCEFAGYSVYSTSCDDLDITDDLIITGVEGQNATVINVDVPEVDVTNWSNKTQSLYYYEEDGFRHFDVYRDEESLIPNASECEESCSSLAFSLQDVTLSGGFDYAGGAIRMESWGCYEGELNLTRVIFDGNTAAYEGGAVYAEGTLNVTECTFTENSVFDGHGGALAYWGDYGCDMTPFVATISDSTFTRNNAFEGEGGAISSRYGAVMTIENSTISDNGALYAGAGISNSFAELTLTGSTVSNNHGVSPMKRRMEPYAEGPEEERELYGPIFGGGIFHTTSPYARFKSRKIGPMSDQKLIIVDSTIEGNTATLGGGGVSVNSPEDGCGIGLRSLFDGGSLLFDSFLGFCDLESSIIVEEEQEELPVLELSISGSTIQGNSAFAGGGIHHGPLTTEMTIDSSTIADNLSPLGGGVANRWIMTVTNSTISGNAPGLETTIPELFEEIRPTVEEQLNLIPIPLGGGGGVLNLGRGEFENTTISGNTTQGSGAGILNLTGPLYFIYYLETNPGLFPTPTPSSSPSPSPTSSPLPKKEVIPMVVPAPGTFLRSVTVTNNAIVDLPEFELNLEPLSANITFDPDGIDLVRNGGGIATYFGGITLRNSLVAGNSDDFENLEILFDQFREMAESEEPEILFSSEADYAPDCFQFQDVLGPLCEDYLEGSPFLIEEICKPLSPALNSEFYNLIGNNTGCGAFVPENDNEDLVGTGDAPIDPLLGPLADNGGATETHYPLAGSPVLDGGNPTGALSASAAGEAAFACPAVDQLGQSRPFDATLNGTSRCDIGALEARVDCFAIPQGVAVIDNCGVCGGDGASCLPTPTPTPDVLTVECTDVDISSELFDIDGTGLRQVAFIRKVERRARRAGARGGRRFVRKARKLYNDTLWASVWSLDTVQSLDCTGGDVMTQCVQVSNVDALEQTLSASNQLHVYARRFINRYARNGGKTKTVKKLRTRARRMLGKVQSKIEGLPTTNTQCNL